MQRLTNSKSLCQTAGASAYRGQTQIGLKELKSVSDCFAFRYFGDSAGYDYQMCSAPMQLVTPRVVMMAVRMLMMSWMINFQVSLFQFIIHNS